MSKKKKTKREGQKRPSRTLATLEKGRGKKAGPATARDRIRTERAVIEDPWDGSPAEATRTVDTITLLYRRGQIDHLQHRAAATYRHAAEVCGGGIPCALDQSSVRAPTPGTRSPTEAQMRAAGLLADASRILGLLDGRIVSMIAVEGYSIEQAAARLFGLSTDGKAKRSDTEHTGRRLRLALSCLADGWWPPAGRRGPGVRP